jgi:hypothetical protein
MNPGTDKPVVEVKQPRIKKLKPAVQSNLVLPAPTLLDGARDNTLSTSVDKKFKSIYVIEPNGKKVKLIVKPDVGAKEKAHAMPQALKNAVYAILSSVLAGQGQGPDGSTQWVVENWPRVNRHYQGKMDAYILKAIPAGRCGVQSYSAPFKTWVRIATDKLELINISLKTSKVAQHQTNKRKATASEPEPQITF